MIFIELPLFSVDLQLNNEELRKVQGDIIADPTRGDVIPGGGLRKLRVAIGGRGKRGSARVVYFIRHADRCCLAYAYAKNVQGDMTP